MPERGEVRRGEGDKWKKGRENKKSRGEENIEKEKRGKKCTLNKDIFYWLL